MTNPIMSSTLNLPQTHSSSSFLPAPTFLPAVTSFQPSSFQSSASFSADTPFQSSSLYSNQSYLVPPQPFNPSFPSFNSNSSLISLPSTASFQSCNLKLVQTANGFFYIHKFFREISAFTPEGTTKQIYYIKGFYLAEIKAYTCDFVCVHMCLLPFHTSP
jgi:hypothetical protein